MRVVVRTDAGPLIGGGHAMRCLTLADAMALNGAEVVFACAVMPDAIANRITGSGHRLVRIPASPELQRKGADWHLPPLGTEAQLEDAKATEALVGTADWLIVDHYLLDARWHSQARSFAAKLLVVDDLGNRPYHCDLLLDQGFGRSASDYEQLVLQDARVLTGSAYTLLRPEFARERQRALARRQETTRVHRLMVSMGTTDPGGMTSEIVETALTTTPDCRIDVVLGPQALSLGRLRHLASGDARVTIHVDSHEMALLMRDADLAIGAAGTTSWERCCLGLPAIALVLAENQRPGALALQEAGAGVVVEDTAPVGSLLKGLLSDPERLSVMSAAAFAIVDGRGTERVVAAMTERQLPLTTDIALRPASMDDAEVLWLWRNDPVTRRQSRNPDAIAWKDHIRWLGPILADPRRVLLIAEQNGTGVGMVRFDPLEPGGHEVSISVASEHRGSGIGKAILKAGCAQIRTTAINAFVQAGNKPSRRMFESLEFKPLRSAEMGFLRYVLKVNDAGAAWRSQD